MPSCAAWEEEVRAWALVLQAAGRAPGTVHVRRSHLRGLGAELGPAGVGPWAVTVDDLTQWSGSQSWARNTRRSVLASVRGFYRWGQQTARVAADPTAGLPSVQAKAPNPRPCPESVYRAALLAAEPRVVVMLRLAAEMGLRRAEVAQVHARDLVPDLAGLSLVVHGKGDKPRQVPLPAELGALVVRQTAGGWAFPGGTAAGHLSPDRVGRLVSAALGPGVSMHTLRHRFATRAYLVGRDLPVVQDLLGHASPETTRAYVAVPALAMRRTVEAVAEVVA